MFLYIGKTAHKNHVFEGVHTGTKTVSLLCFSDTGYGRGNARRKNESKELNGAEIQIFLN